MGLASSGEKPPALGMIRLNGEAVLHIQLPLYLAFFEFVHNTRCRTKALLTFLLAVLLAPCNPS